MSSDNDADLIIEQDIARQKKKDKEKKNVTSDVVLDKDQSMRMWDLAIKDCPEDYTFQIRTYKDGYQKGS